MTENLVHVGSDLAPHAYTTNFPGQGLKARVVYRANYHIAVD